MHWIIHTNSCDSACEVSCQIEARMTSFCAQSTPKCQYFIVLAVYLFDSWFRWQHFCPLKHCRLFNVQHSRPNRSSRIESSRFLDFFFSLKRKLFSRRKIRRISCFVTNVLVNPIQIQDLWIFLVGIFWLNFGREQLIKDKYTIQSNGAHSLNDPLNNDPNIMFTNWSTKFRLVKWAWMHVEQVCQRKCRSDMFPSWLFRQSIGRSRTSKWWNFPLFYHHFHPSWLLFRE